MSAFKRWKGAILAFVVGLLIERLFPGVRAGLDAALEYRRASAGNRTPSDTAEAPPPTEASQFSHDQLVSAALVMLGVYKEAFRELGVEASPDEVRGMFNRAWDRSYRRTVEHLGPPSSEELADIAGWRPKVAGWFMRTLTSAVPTVPEHLDQSTVTATAVISNGAATKIVEREDTRDNITEIVSRFTEVMETWEREEKPEPYLVVLQQGILALKAHAHGANGEKQDSQTRQS